MKTGLIIFLMFFIYMIATQKYYKKENYKYYETFDSVHKKIVRIYYKE